VTKPRLLFLDDEYWRHNTADERYGQKFDVFHCLTVSQLSAAIEGERFDVISLDHDLAEAKTGMHAVRAVCELPSWKQPGQVIVHSWNQPAAENMVSYLRQAGLNVVREMFRAPDGSEP
jgi:hypothetical protein